MTSDELHAYEAALDDVSGEPCSRPIGAPNSAARRAWNLSRELSNLRMFYRRHVEGRCGGCFACREDIKPTAPELALAKGAEP